MSNSLDGDRDPLPDDQAKPEQDVDAEDSSTPETDEAAPPAEASNEEEEAAPPKPKRRGASQRISELVSARKQLEEENARLYGLLKQGEQPKPEAPKAPTRDQFDDYEEFIEAKAAHVAQARFDELTQKQQAESLQRRAAESARQIEAKWQESHATAQDAFDDYEGIFREVGTSIRDVQADAIKQADDPAAVVYYLGKNPKVLESFRELEGVALLREVGRLEERIQRQKGQQSKAPKPVTPARGSPPTSSEPSDKDDMKTWQAKRAKQLGR